MFLFRPIPYCQHCICATFHVKWTNIFRDAACFFTKVVNSLNPHLPALTFTYHSWDFQKSPPQVELRWNKEHFSWLWKGFRWGKKNNAFWDIKRWESHRKPLQNARVRFLRPMNRSIVFTIYFLKEILRKTVTRFETSFTTILLKS